MLASSAEYSCEIELQKEASKMRRSLIGSPIKARPHLRYWLPQNFVFLNNLHYSFNSAENTSSIQRFILKILN